MSTRSLLRTLTRVLAVLALLVVALVAAAWIYTLPSKPDAFYAAGLPSDARPGTLLRSEPYTRTPRADAMVLRILYTTTRSDNVPALASAIVAIPNAPASAPRPVIAWAHGTTGIAPGCAPSVLGSAFAHVPAVDELIREGWAFVATDYIGLGTSGGHAYLAGDDAARAMLDAVRAARTLPDANLDNRVAVWGHSQGGHTALWTGVRASDYAPDIALTGVAAFAPASDLALLVPKVQHNPFGRIVSAYLIEAYAARYADVRDGGYATAFTRLVTGDIARRCVRGWDTVFSVLQSGLLPRDGLFARDPATGPLGNRLKDNTPTGAIAAPVFIAGGKDDDLVLSAVQDAYVRARCIAGQALDYRTYGADHVSLVAARSPLAPDLMAWTRDRFAGRPAANTCPPR